MIKAWASSSIPWLQTRGFDLIRDEAFSDGKVIFIASIRSQFSYKLVVLTHSFVQPDKAGKTPTELGMITISNFIVNDITKNLALLDFLQFMQTTIENLRYKSFRTVKPNWIPHLLLSPHIRLNDSILQTSMLLDRIAMEFDDMKSLFLHSFWTDLELKRVRKIDVEKDKIAQIYVDAIDGRIKLLKRHILLIKDWLSQFLALRNIASMYWLAIIVGLATIAGVIGVHNIQIGLGKLITVIFKLSESLFTNLR